MILKALLNHLSGETPLGEKTLWVIICFLFVLPSLGALCHITAKRQFLVWSSSARNVLIAKVYRKALVLGVSARGAMSAGEITNLFSTDTNNITMLFFQIGIHQGNLFMFNFAYISPFPTPFIFQAI